MITDKKLKRIARITIPILKKNGVIKAGIFGSYARNQAKKTSDIDFLVSLRKGKSLLDLSHLKHQLESLLKREVDLVEYDTIKPRIKAKIMNEEVKLL